MRTLTVPVSITDEMSSLGMIAAACALDVTVLLPTSRSGHPDTIRPDRQALGEQTPSQILRADVRAASEFPEATAAALFMNAVLARNVQTDQGEWIEGRRDHNCWAFVGRTSNEVELKTTGWLIRPDSDQDSPSTEQPAPQPSGRPIPSPESIVISNMRMPPRPTTIQPRAMSEGELMIGLIEELEEALIVHVYDERPVPANNEALKMIVEARRRLGLAPTTIETSPVFEVTVWFNEPGDTTARRREWISTIEDAMTAHAAHATALKDFERAHPGMVMSGFQIVMTEQGAN